MSLSQATAAIATATDVGVMGICYQVLGLSLGFTVFCGPIMGGVANFFINRYWCFCAAGENIYWQVLTYLSDCLIPAVVNATGVLALVEHAATGCDRDGSFID